MKTTKEMRARLEDLRRRDGLLQPAAVVEDARDESSPLHPLFEWDDRKAAELQRLDRAREIVRLVVFEVTYRGVPVGQAPVYLRSANSRSGYAPTLRPRSDEQERRADLELELRAVAGHVRRAMLLGAALDEVELVRQRIAELIGIPLAGDGAAAGVVESQAA